MLAELWSAVKSIAAAAWLILELAIIVIFFPYHTQSPEPISFRPEAADQKFYDQTYQPDERELKYYEMARQSAETNRPVIRQFIAGYHLEHARILDVGAGGGF